MSVTSNRREGLARQIESVRAMIDRITGCDDATVLSGVDESLRGRMADPRLMPRLAMRRARKLVSAGLLSLPRDETEAALWAGDADGVVLLIDAVGAHILWPEIIRLVRRTELEALNSALRFDARAIALRGRTHDFGVAALGCAADESAELAVRVRREGAASWACWLAVRDPVSARRLRVLTPQSIADAVPRVLPEDPADREHRRRIVDLELAAMMANADEREVA